jgi:hypothetical protein
MAGLPGEFRQSFPRDGGEFAVPPCAIAARFGKFVFPELASGQDGRTA